MDKFEEQSNDIRKFMLDLHENKRPLSDKQIAILSRKFFDRDKDPKKSFDVEMSHVMHGFEWGMRAYRQIIEGNDLQPPENT
jgi:hypothetical protein